jgi:hypothetical protein
MNAEVFANLLLARARFAVDCERYPIKRHHRSVAHRYAPNSSTITRTMSSTVTGFMTSPA